MVTVAVVLSPFMLRDVFKEVYDGICRGSLYVGVLPCSESHVQANHSASPNQGVQCMFACSSGCSTVNATVCAPKLNRSCQHENGGFQSLTNECNQFSQFNPQLLSRNCLKRRLRSN